MTVTVNDTQDQRYPAEVLKLIKASPSVTLRIHHRATTTDGTGGYLLAMKKPAGKRLFINGYMAQADTTGTFVQIYDNDTAAAAGEVITIMPCALQSTGASTPVSLPVPIEVNTGVVYTLPGAAGNQIYSVHLFATLVG